MKISHFLQFNDILRQFELMVELNIVLVDLLAVENVGDNLRV